jgi:hypothetical protein
MTSPSQSPETSVLFDLTRGIALVSPSSGSSAVSSPPPLPSDAVTAVGPAQSAAPALPPVLEKPIRLAALDGKLSYFPGVKSKDVAVETVRPTDNPDLIWDPTSHDVIAWGDVIAYNVSPADLVTVVERTAAIRDFKRFSTRSPQVMRVFPDDRQYRSGQTVEIDLSDVKARGLIVFNVSGDGTIQMLYPNRSDQSPVPSARMRIPLRVREPFGAEQVVAITSQERLVDLEQILAQADQRRASSQVIRALQRYISPDTRIGSVGFFTAP